jgi:hypothetical protein
MTLPLSPAAHAIRERGRLHWYIDLRAQKGTEVAKWGTTVTNPVTSQRENLVNGMDQAPKMLSNLGTNLKRAPGGMCQNLVGPFPFQQRSCFWGHQPSSSS